ncbi:MAG: hypothetical protein ACOCXJ_01765 [Planctomycetota bacterium]
MRKRLRATHAGLLDGDPAPLARRLDAVDDSLNAEERERQVWRWRFTIGVFVLLTAMWVVGLIQLRRRSWPRPAALGITLTAAGCIIIAILFWPHGPLAALLLLLILIPPLIGVWESDHNRKRRRFLMAQDELRAVFTELRGCSRRGADERAVCIQQIQDTLQDLLMQGTPCRELHAGFQALDRAAATVAANSGQRAQPFRRPGAELLPTGPGDHATRAASRQAPGLAAQQQAAIEEALHWATPIVEQALRLKVEKVVMHGADSDACTT